MRRSTRHAGRRDRSTTVTRGVRGMLATVLALGSTALAADDCSDAELVEAGRSVAFDTTTATPSPTEFDPALCGGSFFTGLGPDVWFRLDLRSSGVLRLSTCDPAGFDTDLSLHAGSCDALVMLACNGDAVADRACQPRYSALEVEIESPGEHLVRLGGFDGTVGRGTLQVEFEPSCPADFDGDGIVEGRDLGRFFVEWGECEGCRADLDGDGIVGGADLGRLFQFWGPCP